jgi:hypothetical protein
MSSEVDPKNIIMVTLDEIPEEQRKAFEAHLKSRRSVRRLRKRGSSKSSSPASRRRGKVR